MARVTAEDCLVVVPNPFVLVRVAAKRARQLARGALPMLPGDDKATVMALREIAGGQVSETVLDEADLPLASPASLDLDPLD